MAESITTTRQLREDIVLLLPEDVLIEILVRLPVKSLMSFKCVCKSWYYLISSPVFIRKHFHHYNNPDKSGHFLMVSNRSGFPGNVFSLISSNHDNQLARCCLPTEIDTTLLKDFVGTDNEFFTYSCHGLGLVCFTNPVNDNVALWNPITREFRILPELLEPICISPHTRDYYPPYIFCGLGFDSTSYDYKLVHFGYRRVHGDSDIEEEPVSLYSFNTNSWKILDLKFIGFPWPYDHNDAYINGLPWWLAIESSRYNVSPLTIGYDFIASFDVNAEMFKYYQLPEACRGLIDYFYSLVQLQSHVALGVCPHDYIAGQDKSFDIWVMEESVEEVTWTKIFSVGPFQNIDRVIGFWPNSNILVLKQESKQIMLYDLTTHETMHYELEVPTDVEIRSIFVFTDSVIHFGGKIE